MCVCVYVYALNPKPSADIPGPTMNPKVQAFRYCTGLAGMF